MTATGKMTQTFSTKQVGLKYGFRSGLEEQIAAELAEQGISFEFEPYALGYLIPARSAKYTPDFILPNGVVIETKGRFLTADRKKHLLVREHNPDVDIRFLFTNPNSRISKTSKTTYAMWCDKNGFKYAKAASKAQRKKGAFSVPEEWVI